MISPKQFYEALLESEITKFCGVPDSLLKSFCGYVSEHSASDNHTITANEGSAIALAAGQYIATGSPSLVYMQNSGFGNAVNPLLSLADPLVYGVPMLIMIGWRGEPGVKDEPQHVKQGAVMESLLEACQIPYKILSSDSEDVSCFVKNMVTMAVSKSSPVVVLVKKGTFQPYSWKDKPSQDLEMFREQAIEAVVKSCDERCIFVSTTGMPSRELYEIRERNNHAHDRDFLTVGSMGHASMIALGIAETQSAKTIVCLDGDGASIMHLGNLTTVGQSDSHNLIHVLLNNGAHDSVGGQPTCGFGIDLAAIALASGYKTAAVVTSNDEISSVIEICQNSMGPHFVEIKINKGARSNLGRPGSSPRDNIVALIDYLKKT